MKQLTKKAIEKYVNSPYHCPYCGSENITSEFFEPEGNYQTVQCDDCKEKWDEVFELVTIEPKES